MWVLKDSKVLYENCGLLFSFAFCYSIFRPISF